MSLTDILLNTSIGFSSGLIAGIAGLGSTLTTRAKELELTKDTESVERAEDLRLYDKLAKYGLPPLAGLILYAPALRLMEHSLVESTIGGANFIVSAYAGIYIGKKIRKYSGIGKKSKRHQKSEM